LRRWPRGSTCPKPRSAPLIDFYSFLHETPRGAYDIYLSNGVTDRILGNEETAAVLCEGLGVSLGEPSSTGIATVSMTSCTGLCECGPAALVNGLAIQAVDTDRAREMVRLIKAGINVADWPLGWFLITDRLEQKGPLLQNQLVAGAATERAIKLGPDATLNELELAGLRGCGGAGFPVAQKWRLCRDATSQQSGRVVVCNADEGEPGTFKDRALLNSHIEAVLEGMSVCAVTIGATTGLIYLRHEYDFLRDRIAQKIEARRESGLLGRNLLGHHGIDFDIEIHMGAGSYVCGEESAQIESLEGKRGIPRIRPPFPVTNGYFGRPTVVNNVETLAYAAVVLERGAGAVGHDGVEPGFKLLSISGDCERPGVYEIPLGTPVRDLLEACGGERAHAVQVGGPGGTLISAAEFDRRMSFSDLNSAGAFIVFDETRDLFEVAANFTHFFAHESCGFCTPCRVGTRMLTQMTDKIADGHGARLDIDQIRRLNKLMTRASHCGLGRAAAVPILTAYRKFPEYFTRRMDDADYKPAFDVEAAIERSREIVREEAAER
jgi:[NiFe] hydrogenase diaphorase moiety large subunit